MHLVKQGIFLFERHNVSMVFTMAYKSYNLTHCPIFG